MRAREKSKVQESHSSKQKFAGKTQGGVAVIDANNSIDKFLRKNEN
jgi:hypothetical protein